MNDSELILNPDGSIYHLHLHPEDVADTIITVGDPERVSAVSRFFDRIEFRAQKREFVTHTGWLGKHRITVISTGIGTDNIDIVLNELDALASIDLKTKQLHASPRQFSFIRLGTTGSLQREIEVDSLLISTGALGLDGLLHFYDAPQFWENPFVASLDKYAREHGWDFPSKPYFVEAGNELLTKFFGDFQPGVTATNIGFYAPQGRRLRARSRWNGYLDFLQNFDFQGNRISNLEMETSAIYGLATLLGHRAVSLNVILANRTNGTFSRNPEKAIRRLIEISLMKIVE